MKTLLTTILLLLFTTGFSAQPRYDTVKTINHRPQPELLIDTCKALVFEPKYEGKKETSYGLKNIDTKSRYVERNGTVYVLPGEWDEKGLSDTEAKIYQDKLEMLTLAFSAYKDSILSDRIKKDAQVSSKLALLNMRDSKLEKERKQKEAYYWAAFLAFLVLTFLYPLHELVKPKIKIASLLFAIVVLGSIDSEAQTGSKYRVRAVKEGSQYTSVPDSMQDKVVLQPEDTAWVLVPKLFTPDGDGLHDVFAPQYKNCRYILIDIYTRQGELITSIRNDEVWKGMGKSQSYIWLGQWKDKSGKITYRSGIFVELQKK